MKIKVQEEWGSSGFGGSANTYTSVNDNGEVGLIQRIYDLQSLQVSHGIMI